MTSSSDCIFCLIASGQAPAICVHEDATTVAFMDVAPASDGHLLVIPRSHHESILDVGDSAITDVARVVQKMARAVQNALTPDGMRVSQFNGRAAGQTVFHYHVHLVPVQAGKHPPSHGRAAGDPDRIKAIAARIRACL